MDNRILYKMLDRANFLRALVGLHSATILALTTVLLLATLIVVTMVVALLAAQEEANSQSTNPPVPKSVNVTAYGAHAQQRLRRRRSRL
jgi:hypothetical protein